MLIIKPLTVMDIPQRMTSLEISQITGKPHNDVLKAIRKMEPAWKKVNGGNFSLVDYCDSKGQLRPCYSLDKTECLYIATKFNDEARAKLVLRWQTLEKERMERTAATKLLATDADIMSEAERIVGQELMRNNQNADGCITISDIAKAMSMDAKLLNSFLCDKGIQSWQRGQFRLKPEFEGRGLAQDRLFVYYSKKGQQKTRSYLVWTPRGRDFINDLVNF
jgi:phage regulator Rha-like protein